MSISTRIALLFWATFKIGFLVFLVMPAQRRHAEFWAAQSRWEDAYDRGDSAGMDAAIKEQCIANPSYDIPECRR